MKPNRLFITLLILGAAAVFQGQTIIKKTVDGALFNLAEAGALIAEAGKTLVVEHIMPKEQRKEEYRNIDLEKGDKILMANGKKVKSVKEIKDIYEAVKTGELFKMGIDRSGQLFIVSIRKADIKSLPEVRRMVITSNGGPDNIYPMAGLGIIAGEKEGHVLVKGVMDDLPGFIKNSGIKGGDRIKAVNGRTIRSVKELEKEYEKIETGSSISLTFERNGREFTSKGNKPEGKGKIIFRTEKK